MQDCLFVVTMHEKPGSFQDQLNRTITQRFAVFVIINSSSYIHCLRSNTITADIIARLRIMQHMDHVSEKMVTLIDIISEPCKT